MCRILLAILAVVLAGCTRSDVEVDTGAVSGSPDTGAMSALSEIGELSPLPDTEIGLSRSAVTEAPDPIPFRWAEGEPGDDPVVAAYFDGSPPVIPHSLVDITPITRSDNQCIDCHLAEEKEPGEPTPIPASHFEDLRNSPGSLGEEVVGARYVCVSCHSRQSDAEPLVENIFER